MVLFVYARLLQPHDFSVYALIVFIFEIIKNLVITGYKEYIITRQDSDKNMYRVAMQSVMCFAILAVILVLSVKKIIFGILDLGAENNVSFNLYGLVFLLDSLLLVELAYIEKKMDFYTLNMISKSAYIVSYLVIGIPLAFWFRNIYVLIVTSLFNVLIQLLVFRFKYVNFPLFGSFSLRGAVRIWKASRIFGLNAMISTFATQFDYVLVQYKLGVTSLAYYERSYKISTIFNTVIKSVQSSLLPWIVVSNDKIAKVNVIGYSMNISAHILVPISVLFSRYDSEVVNLIFGSQWIEMAPVFGAASLALYFRSSYKLFDTSLKGEGHINSLALLNFIYSILISVVILVLSNAGLLEVMYGVVLVIILYYTVLLFKIKRVYDLPLVLVMKWHLPLLYSVFFFNGLMEIYSSHCSIPIIVIMGAIVSHYVIIVGISFTPYSDLILGPIVGLLRRKIV